MDNEELAIEIAQAIFDAPVGFYGYPPVERIQFKHSYGPNMEEVDGGGLCFSALVGVIERKLDQADSNKTSPTQTARNE